MPEDQHSGVLYKRRDVFTRQWRPRWFVLQPQTGILTYYLFSTDEPPSITVGSTPSRRPPAAALASSQDVSVDYDVVPRGTIYLRGCHVKVAEELTRPDEQAFCFVITAPDSNTSPCCLATTTAEARDEWMLKLQRVCNGNTEEDEQVDEQVNEEQPRHQHMEQSDDIRQDEEHALRDVDPDMATAGLTPGMKTKIDSALAKYLPYTENKTEHCWSILFENKDGVTSYQRGGTMIKSVATLDHHPKQIFNLVADIKRRREYEKNVRFDERAQRYNSHTFIDYYAYQPVWPTTAREFLVLFHWRVFERRANEKAIVMIAFSYPDGNDLRPFTDDHVRADLEVSLFLLELHGRNKTKVTRIISYDLCGNIPRSVTNTIMQQQATMPFVISSYLKSTEPLPPSRLSEGDITNEILASEIIERLPDEADGLDCVRRRLRFEGSSCSTIDDDEPLIESMPVEEDKWTEEDAAKPSTLLITLILLTPLVVYNLIEGPTKEVAFLAAAFVAARTVVLLNLGTPLSDQPSNACTGVVSCRFSVNLRGFLRFLAKRREEAPEGRELSVVPLVVKAIGKALSEIDGMNCKKTNIPLLGVGGCFLQRDINVSVLGTSQGTKEQLMTITDVSNLTLEQVALKIDKGGTTRETESFWTNAMHTVGVVLGINGDKTLGSCLVVTSPDSEGHEIDFGIAPSRGFNAVVVVGGVRLTKQPSSTSIASPTPRKPPKPLLAMTISVDCPACSIAECRRFAERVQELIEFADM